MAALEMKTPLHIGVSPGNNNEQNLICNMPCKLSLNVESSFICFRVVCSNL